MARVKPTTLDVETRRVLSNCRCDGNLVYLPPTQLDRKLYLSVNKVLEELGGKWNRHKKAHIFAEEPLERLDRVVESGEVLFGKQLGYFPTPEPLAKEIVRRAGVRAGHRVLEPSAGDGAIARAARDLCARVLCIEIDEGRCAKLHADGFGLALQADFLRVSANPIYDAVVMNPPFGRQQDVDHILWALHFLRPGDSMLVSVASASVRWRDNKKTTGFRQLVGERGGSIEDLPDGSFVEAGTAVKTVLVCIPGAW
jgi:predicted RNA methylase